MEQLVSDVTLCYHQCYTWIRYSRLALVSSATWAGCCSLGVYDCSVSVASGMYM